MAAANQAEDCGIRQRLVWVIKKESPVKKTEIIEFFGKICFSLRAVHKYPRGIFGDETVTKKVAFTCLNRGTTTTLHLVREARQKKDISAKLESLKLVFTILEQFITVAF
uniref:Uncharacterized protein n=1 Tax=Panagrolaimus superbus TaxID=310955 RepID=A0A914YDU1_9BILA